MFPLRLEHDYEVLDLDEPPELPDPHLAQGFGDLSIGENAQVGEQVRGEGAEGGIQEEVAECMVCSESLPLVTFLPCGCKIVCMDCR